MILYLNMQCCECLHCGRRIIVQRFLFGISHTSSIQVVCAECYLKHGVDEKYAKDNPEKAEAILEFARTERKK